MDGCWDGGFACFHEEIISQEVLSASAPYECRKRDFLSVRQELLETEEASFFREKRYLEAETLAVEELLKGIAEAEGDPVWWNRQFSRP